MSERAKVETYNIQKEKEVGGFVFFSLFLKGKNTRDILILVRFSTGRNDEKTCYLTKRYKNSNFEIYFLII